MYWCKKYLRSLYVLILLAGVASCKRESGTTAGNKVFFDIKGFFEADSARLTKENPLITKTVAHNKVPETRKVHILNWGTELGLFIQSDINRPAWRNSYTVDTSADFLIYTAKDPSLKTREIIIKKVNDKIKWIVIGNHTKNVLYENFEKLSYFPDSLYLIQKKQRVRVLGTDTYQISGFFK